MRVQTKQQGFTLIELVVVIVILGILAATALPKFIDLRVDAATAATQGVAGGLASAFSVNYASFAANSTRTGVVRLSATAQACDGAAGSVLQGGIPTNYSVSTSTVNCSAGGLTAACAVSGPQSQTATATLVCTG